MERDTKTKNPYKLKNQGYCTQGDEEIERIYNQSSEVNYQLYENLVTVMEKSLAIRHIPIIDNIYNSEKKSPQFSLNDTKNMPASEQKTPPLSINNTNMPDKYQMPVSD